MELWETCGHKVSVDVSAYSARILSHLKPRVLADWLDYIET
jgi:hypothetical protein